MQGKHVSDTDYSQPGPKVSAAQMGRALEPHLPRIHRFALGLTRDRDQAQDLTQSTCLRAIEKRHLFDGTGRLDSWCVAICRSIWLNDRRAQAIRATQALDSAPQEALTSSLPAAEENIFAAQVLSEIMALPQAQRETVLLVYGEGYRYSEAAEILGIPIGTVMSRLSAARAKLQGLKPQQMTKGR